MLFKKYLIDLILAGKKTMTSRSKPLYKPGDITNLMANKDYSKVSGKYIRITEVYQRALADFTSLDAQKEGFQNLQGFQQYWVKNIGPWNPQAIVWVHQFEVVPKEELNTQPEERPLRPNPLPPPVSVVFEKCRSELKRDLDLPKEVLERTRELIEKYQYHVDEKAKRRERMHISEDSMYTIHVPPPRHLSPEMIIGACLYIACKEKEVGVTQFQIAKAQGHYDTSALNMACKEARAYFGKSKM